MIIIDTGNGLGCNGGMVMGVVTRVKEMMVQCPVKPIVEELHGSHME